MAQADHNAQQQPVNPAADNTAAGTAAVTPDGVTAPVPDVGELATADTSDAHAAIAAPAAESARISSASDTRTEVPETPRQKSGSHTHQFIGLAGVGLAIVAIYLVTKLQKECQEVLGRTKKLGDELRQRDAQIADMQNELVSVKTQLSAATDKLNTLSAAVAGLNRKQTQESRQQRTTDSTLHPGGKTATTEQQQYTAPAPPPVKKGDVYYATPQLENGVARFWTRTMRSEASPEKMFCLEVLDNAGTYTVNPAATDMIQNDLEMFSKFVKPFTAPSGSTSRTISVIKPGKVTLQGQYWVITDKLEVTIQ